jgi:nucleotide-binding universal stress UspA family protein
MFDALVPASLSKLVGGLATFLHLEDGMSIAASSPSPIQPRPHRHRILVCLDRSPFSEVCLPYAISIAKTFGSEITLTHVMQPHHEHCGSQTADALGWEISRQEARAYLERQQDEASQALGRPIDVRLEQGHPAERIIGLATEIGADLTVLASHGEGGVTQWNLGSTVQQVLAVARGSVFIAHSSSAAPSLVTPKRILLPLDGSVRTESVLPTAARIACAYGAELLLAHIVEEPIASSVLRAGEELVLAAQLAARLEGSAKRYLENVRERLAREVSAVRTVVFRHANERQGLLELSVQEHVDLIVLSAHGAACDPVRPFGSVTAHLLTHSTIPVLVLQDLPPELERPNELAEQLAPALRASYPPEAV